MKIDSELLDSLTTQAKVSLRLRQHFDLRNSPKDWSQRILNALEPGTELPIHRHIKSSETVVILRGSATQFFYDDAGNVTEEITIAVGGDCVGMSVEAGRWHRMVSLESGTVILECKDGKYEPLAEDEIMKLD